MRDEGRHSRRSAAPAPRPTTWSVNRGELNRILALELLAKGQVDALAGGLKIAEGLSDRLLCEWLRELGHSIGG